MQLFDDERLSLLDILTSLLSVHGLELAVRLAIDNGIVLHTAFVGVDRLGPGVLSDVRGFVSQDFIS